MVCHHATCTYRRYAETQVRPHVHREVHQLVHQRTGEEMGFDTGSYPGHSRPDPRWQPQQYEHRDPRDGYQRQAASRRGAYPSHLVRFPAALIPLPRRQRRVTARSAVYWGHHWLAAMTFGMFWLFAAEVVLAWIVLVACCWAMWVMLVTIGWACTLPVTALRR